MKLLLSIVLLIFTIPAQASHISISIDGKPLFPQNDRKGYYWESFRGGIPGRAISGGMEEGRELFVCQANYMGGTHPGKLVDGKCNITYAGREIQQPVFKLLIGRGLHWEAVNSGMIPRNAVMGGNERGQPLFVCQANFGGGVHPGKVVAGKCNIGYGGNEIENRDYRVLVTNGHSGPKSNQGYYTSQTVLEDTGSSLDQGYSTSQVEPVGASQPVAQGGYH